MKVFDWKQVGRFLKRIALAEKYTPAPISNVVRTDMERKQILSKYVVNKVSQGWRIELQTDFDVVLLTGNRPNHILHLLLSIFTLGFWVIVWILIALNGGPKTLSASVDNFGNIHVS